MTTFADQVSSLAIRIANLVEPAVAFGLSPRDPAVVDQVAELLAEYPPDVVSAALGVCSSRHDVAQTLSELSDRIAELDAGLVEVDPDDLDPQESDSIFI